MIDVAEVHVDGVGLVGWITRTGWVDAWCDWEWEDIGLCRPLKA